MDTLAYRDAHPSSIQATNGMMDCLMARLGGGPQLLSFDVGFFEWRESQIPMIEDFPYVGVDFRGDEDLILLVGA